MSSDFVYLDTKASYLLLKFHFSNHFKNALAQFLSF